MERIDIVENLKLWRKDISLYSKNTNGRTKALAYAYNWLTSPTRLMTDREHKTCRKFASIVLKELKQYSGWHFSDIGRIWT
jgi:hypothetical protein